MIEIMVRNGMTERNERNVIMVKNMMAVRNMVTLRVKEIIVRNGVMVRMRLL